MLDMTQGKLMNQQGHFQRLEKMVELTALYVGLGLCSDPVISDVDNGFDPDWSPDETQDHDDGTENTSEPLPPQKWRQNSWALKV